MAKPHLFHRATVSRIIKETADARTYVLAPDVTSFPYKAGQFCTFKVRVDGDDLYRSYSMSSAPETDSEMATTVKRVPGGKVSNWMLDNLVEGDEVTLTRAAGTFCLTPTSAPLLGFSGGSGITPILSLVKSALATTDRKIRLLCADKDRPSVIFDAVLDDLVASHPDRLSVVRHIDAEVGLIEAPAVVDFVGSDTDADCYVCGPEGFMSVVTSALPGPGAVFIEDFDAAPAPVAQSDAPEPASAEKAADVKGTITIHLDRKKATVPRVKGESLLESARRAGFSPPFSCEAGNCGTCMARLSEGSATMRVNDALDPDEVDDGYVLTCQAIPDTPSVTVHYED
jgi:3-ketosteroid 9alpha-monooxygenase subunit B